MYLKTIGVVMAIVLSISLVSAQTKDCPIVPAGLVNVTALEWNVRNESVRVQVSDGNRNEYLQITLIWDVFSEEIEAVAKERAVDALRLVDRLNIERTFFTENDVSHLSLSTFPESDYALYIAEMPLKTVFSVNINTLETTELGLITDNLSDLDVLWYAQDKAITIVEPIYGQGFLSYDVCLDGSCFIDLNQFLGYLAERPQLNSHNSLLAVYDPASSVMSIVDLETKTLQREYPITHQLLQGIHPIWSEDEQAIYFLGFDDNRVNILAYRLDLLTGNTEVVVTLDTESYVELIDYWLIMPEQNMLIWSNLDVHIQCYD
jgi:hypothetical protein